MTHTAPSDSCFLAPDINTLTYLLSCRVLDNILDGVLEQIKALFAYTPTYNRETTMAGSKIAF